MQDERVAEGRVAAVLHRAPLAMRGEKLAEGPRLTLAGVAFVVEPIVEQQDGTVLDCRRDRLEGDVRGLVQIAVEMRECDPGMFGRDRARMRLLVWTYV